jgi:hypothetical protein
VTAQQGSRQARREAFQPNVGPPDILSKDAQQYVDSAAALRREATQDPYLNGEDSRGRVAP